MTDYITNAQNDIENYFETHNIPIYFYYCFFGEIVKIYGIIPLMPDRYYDAEYDDDGNLIVCDNNKYSYKNQVKLFLAHCGGTASWDLALKEACEQCNLTNIYDEYSKFSWVQSDIFDGYLTDNMIDILFNNIRHNDYYKFKMLKGE